MPRSYFNFRSADTIVQHIQVYRQFFEKLVTGKPGDSLLSCSGSIIPSRDAAN
jgi:hypothetical protein